MLDDILRDDDLFWKTVRVRIAYHEAGHAVMVLRLGGRVKYAYAAHKRRQHGICCYSFQEHPGEDGEALIDIAGVMAENVAFGVWIEEGTDGDFHHLKSIADPSFNIVATAFKAQGILKGRWPQVEAIAHLLLDKCFVTNQQIARAYHCGYRSDRRSEYAEIAHTLRTACLMSLAASSPKDEIDMRIPT